MFELMGIAQRYGGRTVLAIAHRVVARGARLAIVGPNGAGKSTLLRLLACLEAPAEGTILVEGLPVRSERARRQARRKITLVEQRPYLFRGTVRENVAFGLTVRGFGADETARRVEDALARLDLGGRGGFADRDVRRLSEGETQRVALARALALESEVLLLDEPGTAADRAAQRALLEALEAEHGRRAVTVCLASHQLEELYRWAEEILALSDGVPVPVTPDNLFRVELPGGGPMQRVSVGPFSVEVLAERAGRATLAIAPEEILLAPGPVPSSARNVVRGRVVRIAEQGAAIRVVVDAGVELVALVTRRSYVELGLAPGSEVYAMFKSVAVKVF